MASKEISGLSTSFLSIETKSNSKYWIRSEKLLWMGALCWSCMALYMVRMTMPLTIAAVVKEFHWTRTQSGAVLSSFFWGYTLTQVLGGYLSDRFGGAVVLLCSTIGWSLITFWTPNILEALRGSASRAHSVLVTTRILLGAFQGVHFPSVSSITSRNLPDKERTFFFSTVGSGSNLGTLLTGYIGSLLLETYGWTPVFYFTGTVGITWVVFLHYYVLKRHLKAPILGVQDNLTSESVTHHRTNVPWITLMKQSAFWAMIIGHVCETYSWHILLSWLPTYFQETHPTAKAWVYNVLPWFVCILANVTGGYVAEWCICKGVSVTFVRKTMHGTSQFLKAGFLILAGTVQSFAASVTCLTFAVAVSGFHSSGIMANPQDVAPRHAGAVFGVMNMAGSILGFVGVYFSSYILATTNSWAAVFNMTATINIIGGLIYACYGSGQALI